MKELQHRIEELEEVVYPSVPGCSPLTFKQVLQGRNSDINAKEGTLRERGQRIKELKEVRAYLAVSSSSCQGLDKNLQKALTMCSEANEARERLNTELEQRNTLQNQAEHVNITSRLLVQSHAASGIWGPVQQLRAPAAHWDRGSCRN